MNEGMPSSYYTPETLSQLYQLPKTTIWKMIREKKFKGVLKVGKHYRIPFQSREDFEKRHKIS